MSSTKPDNSDYSDDDKQLLLDVARRSIRFTLANREEISLKLEKFPQAFQQQRASFVTLRLDSELRGCIGTLEAYQPLVIDVAHNAYSAAFNDPRFPPVANQEFDRLEFHISILSPKEEMHFVSEQDLIEQLRPGIDGLIIQDGDYRSTFLPSVWEQLPQPHQFLQHLKLKAGVSANHWSTTFKAWRYSSANIP